MNHAEQLKEFEHAFTLLTLKYESLTGRELQAIALAVIEGYYEPSECDTYVKLEDVEREFLSTLIKRLSPGGKQ